MHSPPPGTHTPATLERLAAGTVMIGFPGRTVPTGARQLIARGVRGFVLFARNIDDGPQVRALTAELCALAGNDALIAIDHEGGRVNRLQGVATPWPAPMAWASTSCEPRRIPETAASFSGSSTADPSTRYQSA